MTTKTLKSAEFVENLLKKYRKPCVLWSGGKDSMVLLYIVKFIVGVDCDVICWREPWMPKKQRFANKMIDQWGLTVWDWHPEGVALCKGNGRIDVLNHYSFGIKTMVLARGTERPTENKEWLCGRETFLSRPRQKFMPIWDISFHGHKSCDIDACSGSVPLETDLMDTPGMVACAFPLREWSDEEIFQFIEEHSVPYDEKRYKKHSPGKWEILPYQDYTPDYYPTCFKCCDPDEGEFVHCPKLGIQINNISDSVPWQSPRLSYCSLRTKEETK